MENKKIFKLILTEDFEMTNRVLNNIRHLGYSVELFNPFDGELLLSYSESEKRNCIQSDFVCIGLRWKKLEKIDTFIDFKELPRSKKLLSYMGTDITGKQVVYRKLVYTINRCECQDIINLVHPDNSVPNISMPVQILSELIENKEILFARQTQIQEVNDFMVNTYGARPNYTRVKIGIYLLFFNEQMINDVKNLKCRSIPEYHDYLLRADIGFNTETNELVKYRAHLPKSIGFKHMEDVLKAENNTLTLNVKLEKI